MREAFDSDKYFIACVNRDSTNDKINVRGQVEQYAIEVNPYFAKGKAGEAGKDIYHIFLNTKMNMENPNIEKDDALVGLKSYLTEKYPSDSVQWRMFQVVFHNQYNLSISEISLSQLRKSNEDVAFKILFNRLTGSAFWDFRKWIRFIDIELYKLCVGGKTTYQAVKEHFQVTDIFESIDNLKKLLYNE